jgi:acrylyl-CoA reductase (NADPH)
MNTAGGYGEYIRVPADWVTPMPVGMDAREAMIIGTAGFTAALCVEKIEMMGAKPSDGPVLVTGATGGVGSVAVMLLAKLGYEVVASSGKADKVDFLKSIGAASVIGRDELSEPNKRPMLATDYAHAVDCVGGEILSNIIKSLKPQGSVAICGLVASPSFDTTVLPFILRGVNVLGIDSVEIPISDKNRIWQRLATDWKLDGLDTLTTEVSLEQLSNVLGEIFAGQVSGRTLVTHS